MSEDIVTRLRTVDEFSDAIGIMDEAANEIERLRAENDRLGEWATRFISAYMVCRTRLEGAHNLFQRAKEVDAR